MNTYMVTVKAEAGSEDGHTVEVTVMVTNVEESRNVEPCRQRAASGWRDTELTATLSDRRRSRGKPPRCGFGTGLIHATMQLLDWTSREPR